MVNSENLFKGQKLRIDLDKLQDRFSPELLEKLNLEPIGLWNGGFKMVDGNSFGLVLELSDGTSMWFFENELSEIKE